MKQLYYMHIWLVESSMVTVLRKANFSLLQRIYNGVAITHLLHRLSRRGLITIIMAYGHLITITAEDLEDK